MKDPPRFLSVAEVASMLGVSKTAVYNMAHGNQIPHVRIGKTFRFDEQAIREWAGFRRHTEDGAGHRLQLFISGMPPEVRDALRTVLLWLAESLLAVPERDRWPGPQPLPQAPQRPPQQRPVQQGQVQSQPSQQRHARKQPGQQRQVSRTPDQSERTWLTVTETASHLGISQSKLRKMIKDGTFPYLGQKGRPIRIGPEDLADFIRFGCKPPPEGWQVYLYKRNFAALSPDVQQELIEAGYDPESGTFRNPDGTERSE